MKSKPQFITDANGHINVVLTLEDYEALIEEIEDLEDLAAIAERKEEPTSPMEDILKKLGYDFHN